MSARRVLLPALALLALAAWQQSPQPRALRPLATFKEPYSRVRGVADLPDGRVFVADQIEKAVYLADTVKRIKLGTNGAGPQEYQTPVGVFNARGDTAWIHDLQNWRMVMVTPGGIVGPVPRAATAREIVANQVDSLGGLYFDNSSTIRMRKREDPTAERGAVIRFNGTRQDTIVSILIPGPVNPVTFYEWDRWGVGGDGRVAVVRNQQEYRVDWIDAKGVVTQGPRVDEQRLRMTADDKSTYAAKLERGEVGGGRAVPGGTAPPPRPAPNHPEYFPFAQKVLVSPSGQAWVQRYRHLRNEEPLFDVFDARGRRVGSVTLPAGRQVIGFGRRWLYAVRVDDDGLQWLERYSPAI